MVPFSDMSNISGAQWIRVGDSEIETNMSGIKVYDLTWTERNTTFEAIRLRKWRVFVDAGTKLPKRAEWYSKFEPEGEYKFETFSVVTYPNESQIKVLIRNAFGSALRQPGVPEYIGTPQPN